MQALKMFTGGESGNTSVYTILASPSSGYSRDMVLITTQKTSSQGAFVALAMAEASKVRGRIP